MRLKPSISVRYSAEGLTPWQNLGRIYRAELDQPLALQTEPIAAVEVYAAMHGVLRQSLRTARHGRHAAQSEAQSFQPVAALARVVEREGLAPFPPSLGES